MIAWTTSGRIGSLAGVLRSLVHRFAIGVQADQPVGCGTPENEWAKRLTGAMQTRDLCEGARRRAQGARALPAFVP